MKKSYWIIFGFVLFVLILIIVIAVFLISNKSDEIKGDEFALLRQTNMLSHAHHF